MCDGPLNTAITNITIIAIYIYMRANILKATIARPRRVHFPVGCAAGSDQAQHTTIIHHPNIFHPTPRRASGRLEEPPSHLSRKPVSSLSVSVAHAAPKAVVERAVVERAVAEGGDLHRDRHLRERSVPSEW